VRTRDKHNAGSVKWGGRKPVPEEKKSDPDQISNRTSDKENDDAEESLTR